MECCYPVDCGEYAVAPMLVPTYCSRKYCEPKEEPCYPRLPRCQKPKYYCTEKPCRTPVYDCCEPPPQKGCCSPIAPRRAPCPEPEPCCYERPCCRPVKTKYIMPCYRYEDGRIVQKFPVSAFKRNGMQDVEHSTLGTANFLVRHPRDVAIECEVSQHHYKVADPAKVPPYCPKYALGCSSLKKKPVEANQPTVLMRRACEVACGTRKRKPFVVSSYAADPHNEIRRFHSEDERGNCCFHFERKKPPKCDPCWAPGACQPCSPCHSSPACCPTQCLECQYVDGVYAHPTDPTSCCPFS